MASRLFSTAGSFPGFTGQESDAEKLEQVVNYMYQLGEQYRYILYLLEQDEED